MCTHSVSNVKVAYLWLEWRFNAPSSQALPVKPLKPPETSQGTKDMSGLKTEGLATSVKHFRSSTE